MRIEEATSPAADQRGPPIYVRSGRSLCLSVSAYTKGIRWTTNIL